MKGFILYNGPKENVEVNLLLQEAKRQSIEFDVVNPKTISINAGNEINHLLIDGENKDFPDFVIAAFSKLDYESHAIMQQFESMGVLCINKSSTLQATQDKLLTTQKLVQAGVPVPKTMLISSTTTLDIIEQEFNYPVVVKTLTGQKGGGVFLVHNTAEMKNILQLKQAAGIDDELIIQEMIEDSKGHDIRVVVFGHKAVDCALRESASADEFRSNYAIGGKLSSHELTPKIKEIAEKVASTLDLFIGGIDLLTHKDGYVVCEANSLPGFYLPRQESPWSIDIPKALFKSIEDELSK